MIRQESERKGSREDKTEEERRKKKKKKKKQQKQKERKERRNGIRMEKDDGRERKKKKKKKEGRKEEKLKVVRGKSGRRNRVARLDREGPRLGVGERETGLTCRPRGDWRSGQMPAGLLVAREPVACVLILASSWLLVLRSGRRVGGVAGECVHKGIRAAVVQC